ncbi:HAD family hydrolase [Nanoarchaeota archaeon]
MKYKLVCFDLDGTLVDDTIFIWQTLHDFFGTDKEKRREVIDKFEKGEITYSEWANIDALMFREKGATKEQIAEAISALRLMDGARETVAELKKNGLKLAVISGSISIVLDVLFPDHPFDDVMINYFDFDPSGVISGCRATKFDFEHKATGLLQIAEREGFDSSECVFVGDNHNDIKAAETAGLSIAFNSKSDTLCEVADVVIPKENKDLRAVLPHILGE